jgi:Zn-dependent protease
MRALAYVLGGILNLMLLGGGSELAGFKPWQTIIVLAVLNFAAVFLHELGHAWAFRYVGGSVSRIVVLFGQYDVTAKQFSLSKRSGFGDIGGYVAGQYASAGPTVRDQIMVSVAGPAANILSGVIAGAIAWAWPSPVAPMASAPVDGSVDIATLPSSIDLPAILHQVDLAAQANDISTIGHAALILFAVLSLGMALINLIPFHGSDGQKLLRSLNTKRTIKR